MIPISLPKLDLNEVPEQQRVFVLERRLHLLVEQLDSTLRMIEPSDINVADGKTLQDVLNEIASQ